MFSFVGKFRVKKNIREWQQLTLKFTIVSKQSFWDPNCPHFLPVRLLSLFSCVFSETALNYLMTSHLTESKLGSFQWSLKPSDILEAVVKIPGIMQTNWPHFGSLTSSTVKVFTPQESINAADQKGFLFGWFSWRKVIGFPGVGHFLVVISISWRAHHCNSLYSVLHRPTHISLNQAPLPISDLSEDDSLSLGIIHFQTSPLSVYCSNVSFSFGIKGWNFFPYPFFCFTFLKVKTKFPKALCVYICVFLAHLLPPLDCKLIESKYFHLCCIFIWLYT